MKQSIIFVFLLAIQYTIPLSAVLSSNGPATENAVSLPEKVVDPGTVRNLGESPLSNTLPSVNESEDITKRNVEISFPRRFFLDQYCGDHFEKTLLQNNELFVDKTMFIAELIERHHKYSVITRPSGWGKTFNMEMTRLFFDLPHDEYGKIDQYKRDLYRSYFEGNANITLPDNKSYSVTLPLKICKNENAMKEIGKHPVIYISFANGGNSYEKFIENFADQITGLIVRKSYARFLTPKCDETYHPRGCFELLNSSTEAIVQIQNRCYRENLLADSLHILSSLLTNYFYRRAVVLVDGFDYPLNQMMHKKDDFVATINFLESLFTNTFKMGASRIFVGVINGVLQVSKAGISSGLASSLRCSVLDPFLSAHFGFIETEITALLEKNAPFSYTLDDIRKWYNGYSSRDGEYRMYNPQSIRRFMKEKKLQNYCVTSFPLGSNPPHDFPAQLFMSDRNQELIQQLFTGYTTITILNPSQVFYEVDSANQLSSVLTALGYLSFRKNGVSTYSWLVMIPNKEVHYLFENKIKQWTRERGIHVENEVILNTTLSLIQTNFKLGEESEISTSFETLLSLINLNVSKKDFHCNAIFGLLLTKNDYWHLNRTFDSPYDCDIWLIPKLHLRSSNDTINQTAIKLAIKGFGETPFQWRVQITNAPPLRFSEPFFNTS